MAYFRRFGVKEPRHSEKKNGKKCYLYRSTRLFFLFKHIFEDIRSCNPANLYTRFALSQSQNTCSPRITMLSGRYTLQELAHPSWKRFCPTRCNAYRRRTQNVPRHFVSRSSYVVAVGDPKIRPRNEQVVPERDGAAGQGNRQSRAAPGGLHGPDHARHSPEVRKRLLQRSS